MLLYILLYILLSILLSILLCCACIFACGGAFARVKKNEEKKQKNEKGTPLLGFMYKHVLNATEKHRQSCAGIAGGGGVGGGPLVFDGYANICMYMYMYIYINAYMHICR
jgi:hypothetical protein